MMYSMILTWTFCLASSVTAMPAKTEPQYPIVNMTFHGGPAQYSMSFLANGDVYSTNNDMSVDMIDAGEYNAANLCEFYTDHEKTLLQRYYPGSIRFLVGPPQPIRAVSCLGVCIANGDFCSDGHNVLGECCNGYCNFHFEDRTCHPWTDVAE